MVNIGVILELANDYLVNANVFQEGGNVVKEYANLCSATALYLLALQSEDLTEETRKNLISKCELYIKRQENIEKSHFSTLLQGQLSHKKVEISESVDGIILKSEGKQENEEIEHFYSDSEDSVDIPIACIESKGIKSTKKKSHVFESNANNIKLENETILQDVEIVEVPEVNVIDVSNSEVKLINHENHESEQGFYIFNHEQLKSLSKRFQGTINPDCKMASVLENGNLRTLGKNTVHKKCKDYLCPPETQIQEWFADPVQARIRVIALDPYGLMKNLKSNRTKDDKDSFKAQYVCQNENCHARIIVRSVNPDPQGNKWGIYGCLSHQHPLPRTNKSEIIFENKLVAESFFDQHLKSMYSRQHGHGNAWKYHGYVCRRTKLVTGYVPCQSRFSIAPTFPRDKNVMVLPNEHRPYSISGYFYHSHENDEKWNRDEFGGWKTNGIRKNASNKPKTKHYPRIKNGKILPLWARATMTVEEVLQAQKDREEANRKAGNLGFYAGKKFPKKEKSRTKQKIKSEKNK